MPRTKRRVNVALSNLLNRREPVLDPVVSGAERGMGEWVRLTEAVRARSRASVSSPGLRSYPAGSKAQVVGRADGWVELLDPGTQERGWVYHAYVSPIDTAQAEPNGQAPVKVVSPSSPKPTRAAERTSRILDAPNLGGAGAPKVKKAKRQSRGLFKRRKSRREQRAWSIGPAR